MELIWIWVDGSVFVETLIDSEDFFFCNFLFSDLRILIILVLNNLTRPAAAPQAKGYPSSLISCLTTSTSHSFITWTSTSASTWSWPSPAWSPAPHPPQNSSWTWVQCWLLSFSSTLSTLCQLLPTTLNIIASCSTKLHLHLPLPHTDRLVSSSCSCLIFIFITFQISINSTEPRNMKFW